MCGYHFGIRFLFIDFWRCFGISTKTQDHQINEEIRDKEVRLIGSDGEQLGVMSSAQALKIADEAGLDLVKISPKAVPPVCKVMDYGKFRFEQAKREKEAKKNQHVVEIKEVRMSPGIDVGDFNTKLRSAQKFLSEGNRVKVTVRFRGREMAHTEIGLNLLQGFRRSVLCHRQYGQAPQAGGPSYVHVPGAQDSEGTEEGCQGTRSCRGRRKGCRGKPVTTVGCFKSRMKGETYYAQAENQNPQRC